MPDTRDHPLPIYDTFGSGIRCCHCGRWLMAEPLKSNPRRFLVTHPEMDERVIELGIPIDCWCPNNARSWVIEPYQPKIYPVDPVTGLIDEMGGIV